MHSCLPFTESATLEIRYFGFIEKQSPWRAALSHNVMPSNGRCSVDENFYWNFVRQHIQFLNWTPRVPYNPDRTEKLYFHLPYAARPSASALNFETLISIQEYESQYTYFTWEIPTSAPVSRYCRVSEYIQMVALTRDAILTCVKKTMIVKMPQISRTESIG